MGTVTSAEFVRQFGTIQRQVQRETVTVTSYGKVVGHYISPEDGELLRQAKAARKAYHPSELPDELWDEIDRAQPSAAARALDRLMEE
ncbi:hypothetical protein [Niveispirillum sp. KHB5.9]|uniref:hypothetical protein n=1 Tax=Niveispirillum sp. KHB5.9 TaxID=3400269 RepID=UPI003A87EECB